MGREHEREREEEIDNDKGIQKKQRNKSKEQDKADTTRPPTRLSILRVLFHGKKDHN